MIHVRVGDLAREEVEAVLRPVSSELAGVTAASREIERAAGDEVRDRLQRFGSLPVGGALLTPGGDLAAAFLIHVVVQSADEPVSRAGIRRALVNGLRRATEWEIGSLALPPLGTGAGNLDAEASARVMLPVLEEHMEERDFPREVTIAVTSEYERDAFQRALAEPPASEGRP